jgi:selenocysteine-specific elongation factor
VFSIRGFGTVVTGTLLDGHFSVGDEVQILPSGMAGRIRGLQTHKQKEEQAQPGSRTAVNISGLSAEQIQRGEVVVRPDQYQSTRRVDARIRLLKEASASLKHGDEVKFFVGASESMATARVLGLEELKPGSEGWMQLELRQPVVTVRGDRYILRRPSPGETLGGGVIIDHQPKNRHKRFDAEVLQSLESLLRGSPADVLFEAALAAQAVPIREIVARSRLEPALAGEALQLLLAEGRLIPLENVADGPITIASENLALTSPHWQALQDRTLQHLESYHREYPLRRGMPREELKSRLKLAPRVFNAIVARLIADHAITEQGTSLARSGHAVTFTEHERAKIETLLRRFEVNPFSTPSVKECQAEVGEEVLNALIEAQVMIPVSPEVIFRKNEYDVMTARIQETLRQNGQISLAEVRDLFSTSRKYAQAMLEHLDALGVTVRDGDFRRLRKP